LLPAFAGLLLGLLFDPENGGDIFLRNFGLSATQHYNPEDRALHHIKFIVITLRLSSQTLTLICG
jgi:hypothetical protein